MLASEVQLLLESMAVRNDETALKQLFHAFYPRLLVFADSFFKNRSIAEELVEDVFIKLWENRTSLPLINSLSAYLFTATKNNILNYQKPLKNQPYLDIEEIDFPLMASYNPEELFISSETLKLLNVAIATLPPKCRLIFQLVKENGLKYRETADLLHISIKTVEAQMSLALKKISEALLSNKGVASPNHFHKK